MTPPAPPPLRLLSLDEANIGLDDVIVRPRQPGTLFIVAIALAIAGWSAWEGVTGALHRAVAAFCVLGLGGGAWMLYRLWHRARRPGAWQMAIGRDRVLIRFRGAMQTGLPAGIPQVIELPWERVASVRRTERTVKERSGRDTHVYRCTYLDFQLRDCDLRPLQGVLVDEQQERAAKWFVQREVQVGVTCDGALRVETSFHGSDIEPAVEEVLGLLEKHLPRDEDVHEDLDLTDPAGLSPAEQDAALRAIGETSAHRAFVLAGKMQPDASTVERYDRVARLIACPEPATLAAPPHPPEAADAIPAIADAGAPALPAPRLLHDSDVQPGPDDRVVKRGIAGHLVVAALCFALAGWMAWRYQAGAMRWGYAAGIGGFAALFGCLVLAGAAELRRRDTWVMVIGPKRILVRYRTRRNQGLDPDKARIVELPLAYIQSVQPVRHKRARITRGSSGEDRQYSTFLDFRIRGLDLGPLADALKGERPPSHPGIRTARDPVQLLPEGVVRVTVGATRPAHDELLRLLGARLPLEAEVAERVGMGGPPAREPLVKARR